ncbi:MAG TPA: hypothetical protein VGQ26_24690 [Streptosporangiaceae bacterium]|jgi:hypothetical protein|nr:hypothetical protein [Streptosporangiaceae bacterium]
MRSPSGFRLHARRVRRYARSFPVVTMAACAVLVIAVGCAKGNGGVAPSKSAIPSAQAAAAGIPLYSTEARNFAFDAVPSVVPADRPIQISFTNNETSPVTHELVVLKLPAGKTAKDVVADAKKKGVKAKRDWEDVGDTGGPVEVGSSAVVTLNLRPGRYAATCWQTGKAGGGTGPPHVALGMIATFTASTSAGAPAPGTAGPMYSVSVKNFTFQGMPTSVPANRPFEVTFINDEAFPIVHEFVVLKLPSGDTAQSVVNDAKKKGPAAEDDWAHFGDSGAPLPIGSSAVVRMDLPPGNYVATCWQTGKVGGGTGPPHVVIGMIASFTATASH